MERIYNETLNLDRLNEKVTLYGWVQKKRNLGGLIFIDLRDRSGIVQLRVKPENKNYNLAESLKNEYVIKVEGIVVERESKNSKLKTGDIAEVTYRSKKYTYKFVSIYKQNKTGKIAIYRNYEKTTLTLITCTNYDSKTQTVYIAELINTEEE